MAAAMPAPVADPNSTVSCNGGVRRHSITKLCKPSVGLSANHHPMGGSRPMAFWGYPRGHRIDPETRCCMQQHTECLMSAWILSLEPEHRQNRWVTTEA